MDERKVQQGGDHEERGRGGMLRARRRRNATTSDEVDDVLERPHKRRADDGRLIQPVSISSFVSASASNGSTLSSSSVQQPTRVCVFAT